ncbi:MAG TPA: YqcI/YcgG family protein [Solirubrobacterales bacterium]
MSQSRLSEFLAASPCPFAQRAAVPLGCSWSDPNPTPARLDDLAARLSRFSADASQDAWVLEIQHDRSLQSLAGAGSLLRSTLEGLRQRDPSVSRPLTDGIEDPDWDFDFQGLSYFISFFGSLYPRWHSRYSGFEETSFLLFQPERGFRRFGVSSARPERSQLSQRVHQLFARRGKSYDLSLNTAAPKSFRYLKPVHSGEPPIAWWRSAPGPPSAER